MRFIHPFIPSPPSHSWFLRLRLLPQMFSPQDARSSLNLLKGQKFLIQSELSFPFFFPFFLNNQALCPGAEGLLSPTHCLVWLTALPINSLGLGAPQGTYHTCGTSKHMSQSPSPALCWGLRASEPPRWEAAPCPPGTYLSFLGL